jgi:quercetin dioxygenase-like cupin family protein
MNSFEAYIRVVVVTLCSGLMVTHPAWSQGSGTGSHNLANDRAHIVLSQVLPILDGAHLKATLVEVNYGPGEASRSHSHPCAVIGYVVEGAVRSQIQGLPEMIYKAGDSFYEAPNRVHLVSANASLTKPAKLVAYLICDHDTPLSVDGPPSSSTKGQSQ